MDAVLFFYIFHMVNCVYFCRGPLAGEKERGWMEGAACIVMLRLIFEKCFRTNFFAEVPICLCIDNWDTSHIFRTVKCLA